jgi:signal transduction histidine kinase/CheY-like chemotaxis protein
VVSSQVFKIHKEAKMYEKTYFRMYTMSVAFMFLFFLVWTFTNFKNLSTIERQYVEIKEAKEETERANNAKTKFLAGMSHEIRTPINAVLGMDEMILRESNDTKILEYANDIYGAGQHLLSLVNQILDSSKIESGKMEITPVEYDLGDMIHTLFNIVVQRTTDTDLGLTVEVDKSLPRKLIGDEMHIKQVMINLLTNAVKYTREGGIWLRIKGQREENILHLYVEVQDTGIGIKKEDISKLFSEFERIEEKRNRNVEGTGLGMSITKKMLGLMGTRLVVESEYGKGSTFSFDLTQKIIDSETIGDFDERVNRLAAKHKKYKESFTAPGVKILVVDDNMMNRKVFIGLLKATQIAIDEADSADASVSLASKNYYDVIFMDHMMPKKDGIEALKEIRAIKDGPCANTPIIVLTANAIVGSEEQYLDAGFDGFLAKPIAPDKLEELLRNTLDESKINIES